jgi:hypothetical protein
MTLAYIALALALALLALAVWAAWDQRSYYDGLRRNSGHDPREKWRIK